MSGLILHLSISQSHVFLLNSRLGLFTAASCIAARKRPFSRSYRAILPSSLAVIHSSTLGFSPRPPVSVCGTGGYICKRLAGFLGSLIRDIISAPEGLEYYQLSASPAYFTTGPIPTAFNALFRQCAVLSLLRHRIATCSRCWNINQLSIDLRFRLGLRTRLTLIRLALIRKPWSYGVRVTLPHYRYSCLHLLFHTLHQISRFSFYAEWNAPLPRFRAQNFGDMLDARLLSTLCRSTSELLRTL